MPVMRRRGYFEIFYLTHLSYILLVTLHCLHSPAGLYWTLLPGLLFLLCKLRTLLALCLDELRGSNSISDRDVSQAIVTPWQWRPQLSSPG